MRIALLFSASVLVALPAMASPFSAQLANYDGPALGFEIPGRDGSRTVDCAGTLPEGESVYFDGVDVTNGGCNFATQQFQTMLCGTSYCGNMFGYNDATLNYRDTDWFVVPGASDPVSFHSYGETDYQVILLYMYDCDNYVYDYVQGYGDLTVTSRALNPGEQLVYWIGTNWFGGDGTEYTWRVDVGGCGTVEAQDMPAAFQLSQNSPNPFNPTTSISFNLDATSQASLKVFDLAGRQVATLVDGLLEGGAHQVQFDGSRLASGVYLYTLEAAGVSETRKMVLMK